MAEKIYVGNAKKITTQYGDMYRLSVTAEDLEKMQANLDNGWINLQMKERREPSAGGMTHYLEVDTWKPEPRDGDAPAAPAKKASGTEDITAEDLLSNVWVLVFFWINEDRIPRLPMSLN